MALKDGSVRSVPDFSRQLTDPKSTPLHKNRAIEIKFDDRAKKILHQLIEYYGMAWLVEQMELAPVTIYRLLAGFSDSARPSTVQRLKEFLVDYDRAK
jgi:hypothetical protein